jgi:Domain of unknown function (DUF4429)/Short C-terminal domain
MIVKCDCQHCGGGIEFDSDELTEENCVIACPHCGQETKLFINSEGPSSAAHEESKPTGESMAAFKARVATEMAQRDAKLKKIEEFLRESETNATIWSKQDKLELAGDRVIIRRRGLANMLASGLNGERTINISTLTGIQMKPGGLFSPGYILFSYAGSKPFVGGVFAATQDPDAFIFGQELNDEVTEFKAKVEKIMQNSRQTAQAVAEPTNLAEELRKLAELKEQGVLSQDEFDAAKRKLLI